MNITPALHCSYSPTVDRQFCHPVAETPAQQPAATAAVYNWENQGEMNILDENDKIGAGGWGSFSSGRPGDPQQVDDWHLC